MLALMLVTTNGFGQGATLDHDLIPFRNSPIYLRLVGSLGRALDYAAGGFHVSVWRGLSGGCKDPWQIHQSGTSDGVGCRTPHNDNAIRDLWIEAAEKYKGAYEAAKVGKPLLLVKGYLALANLAADKAYRAEGIEPPRDPVTQVTDPVGKPGNLGLLTFMGVATLGLLSLGIWAGHKRYHGAEAM
jgi:hypothetical protein